MISSASTNSVMAVMTHNRKSWNQMMSSITGVAPFCMPSCHGSGCPDAASATSALTRGHARADECDQPLEHQHCPMRSFDEKNGLGQAPFAAHHRHDVRRDPLCTALPRAWQLGRRGGTGGNPGLSNHNSSPPAMRLIRACMRQTAYPKTAFRAAFMARPAPMVPT